MAINFKEIEKKWQDKWEKEKAFVVEENSKKSKFYVLEMFPYPSGAGLHMGHAINFTIVDIFARFKRMSGFNVLYPIGYDSLGLPAENAAIKNKTHPREYTEKSIKNFKTQQKRMGFSYDTTTLLNTADPSYYKWDQWIFLKMFEKDLAYKKISVVNWCPKCKTVLANEQAQGGKCERCKSKVQIKSLDQWFFKITSYANELYDEVDKLNWPSRTIAMQKNWIGKSYGTEILFNINGKEWPIFTTRPDTIYGVTFMVVSAYHKDLMTLVTQKQKKEVEKFLEKLKSVSEKELKNMEKEGVFTGSYATNPLTKEKIPVYAGNFVVADYGSGMVMAVPAHDQRDFDFAKKYSIEIKQVIEGKITSSKAYTENGDLINSGEFNGIKNSEAKEKITEYLTKKKIGKKVIQFKLRDWGISRQRYWGTPIPMIHCKKCGIVPVPEADLPVVLPEKVKFGEGNPLETSEEWIKVKCPKCKSDARRETDTMDTFVNSSWYFFRYCDSKNDKKIFDSEKVNHWCPIDLYVGGAEHACMHLIYSRFYTKFLADLKLINFREPVKKLFHQGMLHAADGNKMSKSLGNTIDPIDTVEKYSSDSLRLTLMSFASPDKDTDWDEKVMIGSHKLILKISNYMENIKIGKSSKEIEILINKSIEEITKDIENIDYRMATIRLRTLFDKIISEKEVSKDTIEKAIKMFSLFCPHLSEEFWEKLGNKIFVSLSQWPKADKIKSETKEKSEDLNDKIIRTTKEIIEKLEEKKEVSKVFFYVMPFELNKINIPKIEKEIKKPVKIFSTSDQNKYDPEGKSKKARPNLPGIYLE